MFNLDAQYQVPQLFTLDTRALNHILHHSEHYYKPEIARLTLGEVLGEGVLVVEGEFDLL